MAELPVRPMHKSDFKEMAQSDKDNSDPFRNIDELSSLALQ